MGADARLYVFDYELYRNLVVPTFARLMFGGPVDTWLLDVLRSDEVESLFGEPNSTLVGFAPQGFWESCTYLDAELAVTKTFQNPDGEYPGPWEARACQNRSCSIRDQCPLHRGRGDQLNPVADDWTRWIWKAIVARCLGSGQFLGRSVDCFFYWSLLDELCVPVTHPIRILLERLGRRGIVLGYRGSSGTEGIHGWLSPAEAKELAEHLFALRLPDYDYSFVAMEGFRVQRDILEGRVPGLEFQGMAYDNPNGSFEELSLSYVRTVCSLAAREGKGVLWGNGIA